MVLGTGKVQLSFAEEIPDVKALTGGTVAASQVTGLSGLVASAWAGQEMRSVGPGTSCDRTWSVQTNTTTVITVEEASLTTAPALLNTDTVSISTFGTAVAVASCTGWIGIFDDDLKLPDPKKTYHRLRAHGAGRDYAYKAIHKTEYHSPIKYVVQDLSMLLFAFGQEYVTGTDDGAGASDVDETNGTGIGHTHLDVTSAADYATSDHIQVGTTTQSEVRKITAISTNALTLDKPFRIHHLDAETCNEVTAPYTHTLQIKTGRLPSFTMLALYDETVPFNRRFFGCKINRMTLRSSVDSLLEAEFEIYCAEADNPTAAKPTVTRASTAPYGYQMTAGGIIVNGVTYARLNSFELSLNNNLKEKRYHCDRTGTNPFEFLEGGTETELRFQVTVTNLNFWSLLDGETEFQATIQLQRTASSDEFTFTFKNCKVTEAPHGLPREGGVDVDVVIQMHTDSTTDRSVELQVIDDKPYYGFW